MRTHTLKTWPAQFQGVVDGRKRHEWRRDDRRFEVGDCLILMEWSPSTRAPTGREVRCVVTWVTRDFGVPPGWVCMSISDVGGLSRDVEKRCPMPDCPHGADCVHATAEEERGQRPCMICGATLADRSPCPVPDCPLL